MNWIDVFIIVFICFWLSFFSIKAFSICGVDLLSYIYLWLGVKIIKCNTKLMYRFEKHTGYFNVVTLWLCEFLFKNITHKDEVGLFHAIREVLPIFYFKADKEIPIGVVYKSIVHGNETININTENASTEETPTVRSLFHDRRYSSLQSTRSDWCNPYHKGMSQRGYLFFVEANYRLRADKGK